ncbi:MAG: protein-L-isoaspartate(D-aspartate) O-methyltransferase [Akkermansiaceae bacterium]
MNTSIDKMLHMHLMARGIDDELVLAAMAKVPREIFVLPEYMDRAYDDCPLPIGEGQTISQPYIVALMIQLAHINQNSRVLDIGTGCGYMAAVIAHIAREVCTLETIPELASMAKGHFQELALSNIDARVGDGHLGWPEDGEFDAIIVSCAAEQRPDQLLEQLRIGGRAVIPITKATGQQMLTIYEKNQEGELTSRAYSPVMFVPMV